VTNSTSGRLVTYPNPLLSTNAFYRPETRMAHYLCCTMVLPMPMGICTWVLQVYVVRYTSLIHVVHRTCS